MIYVGIDVAKDKHDCFICSSEGEIIHDVFTIPNNMEGFDALLHEIKSSSSDLGKVKVGLEATGHYSCNILRLCSEFSVKTAIRDKNFKSNPGEF